MNRPPSIDQYTNMTPRLTGETSIFGGVFFLSNFIFGTDRGTKETSQICNIGAMLAGILIDRKQHICKS